MNKCGDCTLCCSTLKVRMAPIKDWLKPAYTKCEHQCEKGCSIYHAKPEACTDFQCVWLASQSMPLRIQMSNRLRPDRCGVVLEFNNQRTITAHCTSLDYVYGELLYVLHEFRGRGLTILVSLPDADLQLDQDGFTELVRIGVDPKTHNIAFMRRVDYDALDKAVKERLAKAYN